MTTISTSSEQPAVASRSTIVIAAGWIGTLLLSKLPLVIARDILGSDIPWITPAWIVTAFLLINATYAWPILKPLRAYFTIMGFIILAPFLLQPLITGSSLWISLIEGQHQIIGVLGDRILLIADTLIVLAALFLIGVKRRQAFLAVGDLKAPVGGTVTTANKRRISWFVLGTATSISLAGFFFLFLVSQNAAVLSNIAVTFPWIPLILLSAGLNALGEEAQFRAAPLATLLPVVGPRHAIWLTSLWFGFGHYYGGFPSGLVGLVYSGGLALLMAKAMLDTHGLSWSWIIHLSIDTVIYIFIVATGG